MCISSRLTAQQQIQMNFKSTEMDTVKCWDGMKKDETQPLVYIRNWICKQAMKIVWWYSFKIIYFIIYAFFFFFFFFAYPALDSIFSIKYEVWIIFSSFHTIFIYIFLEMEFSILMAHTLWTPDSTGFSFRFFFFRCSRWHSISLFNNKSCHDTLYKHISTQCTLFGSTVSMFPIHSDLCIHQFTTIIHFFLFIFMCLFVCVSPYIIRLVNTYVFSNNNNLAKVDTVNQWRNHRNHRYQQRVNILSISNENMKIIFLIIINNNIECWTYSKHSPVYRSHLHHHFIFVIRLLISDTQT